MRGEEWERNAKAVAVKELAGDVGAGRGAREVVGKKDGVGGWHGSVAEAGTGKSIKGGCGVERVSDGEGEDGGREDVLSVAVGDQVEVEDGRILGVITEGGVDGGGGGDERSNLVEGGVGGAATLVQDGSNA